MKTLGLITGEGEMPRTIALEAKRQGYKIVAVAIKDLTEKSIEKYADTVKWFKVGKAGSVIKFLRDGGVDEAVFAGKFPKSLIVKGVLNPDLRLLRFLFNLKDKGDDSILNAVEKELSKDGIKLLDMRDFSKGLLTPEGILTRKGPKKDEWKDIKYGFRIAKGVGRLDIGQTVVVKGQAVMAVEAIEGTDDAILRGGKLAGGGAVVVKVSRPDQDMRLDVPVVGLRTLGCIIKAGIRVLAVEAQSSIFLDKEDFIKKAAAAGVSVVGVSEASLKDKS
jgi:DUF1009 family protein